MLLLVPAGWVTACLFTNMVIQTLCLAMSTKGYPDMIYRPPEAPREGAKEGTGVSRSVRDIAIRTESLKVSVN